MPATDKVKNPYGSTVVQNPFGGPNQVISDIHQNPTGVFGTWSKQDQALFNTSMAEAQWIAELSLIDYQNEYNSPVAQAQRMREAGLNPDLLGVEQGGTSADGSAPGAVAPEGSNPMDVAGNIFSLFSTAMSVANGLMSFKSASESVNSQIIDNVNKLDGFATSFLVDNLVPDSFTSDGQLLEDRKTDIISSARSVAQKRYGFNSRMSKRFEDSVVRKIDSPDFIKQFYETMNKSEESRQDYLYKTSGDLYSQADELMRLLLDPVIKHQHSLEKSMRSRGVSENDYYSDVYGVLDADSFAERENILNTFDSANLRRDFYGSSLYYDMNKSLWKSYKRGNILSGIYLALSYSTRSIKNSLLGTVGNLIK